MPLLATSTLGSDDGFWARLSEPATPTPTTMAARSARRGRRRRSVTVPHLSMPRHGALALAAREEPFEALDPAESEPYDAPHAQGKQREDPVEWELVAPGATWESTPWKRAFEKTSTDFVWRTSDR